MRHKEKAETTERHGINTEKHGKDYNAGYPPWCICFYKRFMKDVSEILLKQPCGKTIELLNEMEDKQHQLFERSEF
ncbi:MAG: hypothetical protein PHF82_01655 [Lutispora sp.]|nr:hypothetical protein [Lutispora sp.]